MHDKIVFNFKLLMMNEIEIQNNLKLNIQNLSLITCANEADILNVALFGLTAKEFKENNHDKKGNLRDFATVEQLVVLSNLESINSMLISQNLSQEQRLVKLNEIAISQIKSLLGHEYLKKLEENERV